jgi:hypothetical protein
VAVCRQLLDAALERGALRGCWAWWPEAVARMLETVPCARQFPACTELRWCLPDPAEQGPPLPAAAYSPAGGAAEFVQLAMHAVQVASHLRQQMRVRHLGGCLPAITVTSSFLHKCI